MIDKTSLPCRLAAGCWRASAASLRIPASGFAEIVHPFVGVVLHADSLAFRLRTRCLAFKDGERCVICQRLAHIHASARVPSIVVALECQPRALEQNLPAQVERLKRELDETWLITAPGRQVLAVLMPLGNGTTAEGYIRRLEAKDLSLSRFLTVYGGETININVAPVELLSLLDPDIGIERAKAIVQYRKKSVIKSQEDLIKIPGFPRAVITRTSGIIGYNSDYFTVRLKVVTAKRERNFTIVMKRAADKCEMVNWRE